VNSLGLSVAIVVLMAAIANIGMFIPAVIPVSSYNSFGPIGIAILVPFSLLTGKKDVGTDRAEGPSTILSFITLGLALLTRKLEKVMIEDREQWVEGVNLEQMTNEELLNRTHVVSERIFGRIDGLAIREGSLRGLVNSIEKMIQKSENPRTPPLTAERARRSAERNFKQMRRRAYRWGYHADHIWAVGWTQSTTEGPIVTIGLPDWPHYP
jgi:hypothetical protein